MLSADLDFPRDASSSNAHCSTGNELGNVHLKPNSLDETIPQNCDDTNAFEPDVIIDDEMVPTQLQLTEQLSKRFEAKESDTTVCDAVLNELVSAMDVPPRTGEDSNETDTTVCDAILNEPVSVMDVSLCFDQDTNSPCKTSEDITDFIHADANPNSPIELNEYNDDIIQVDMKTNSSEPKEISEQKTVQIQHGSNILGIHSSLSDSRPESNSIISNHEISEHNNQDVNYADISLTMNAKHDLTQNANPALGYYVFSPDQVEHTLSSITDICTQDVDTANTCLVSDNNFTERSLETGTSLPLPVSLPDVSDLPGFNDIHEEAGLPLNVMATHHSQADLTSVPMDTGTLPSSGWYTPPQTPPYDGLDICATGPPLDLPANSLYILGTITDQPTHMLVDTGASVTAVSASFYSTLSHCSPLQVSPLPVIRTVSGEELPILGSATLTLQLDQVPYTMQALVIDRLTYPVVIGRDFLMHYGSVIDMQAHTLTLAGNSPIPLQYSSGLPSSVSTPHDPVTVHASATFILPPQSESVIPVYPKTTLTIGSTGLIEPNSKLAERYQVCGASQLVSLSEQHTFPFRVLNPTNKPITMYRCSTMGTYTPSAASMSVIATPDSVTSTSTPPDQSSPVPLDLSDTTLTDDQQMQLRSLVAEYRDIFSLSSEELGRTGLVQHRIDTADHPPIRQRPYRVADTQRGLIEKHVTDMLNQGIIQPSVSPWASPIILVKKKDGTDRFVVDFRRLNSVTRKDSYPLPRIDDALDALNGTKYYSSMDLRSGFWQVEMEPHSREHTAFITYGGLYEFLVLPFGLTNAPSTYQRLMECVLRNLTYKICLIYLDDILVYSKTFDEHLCHLRQVFDRLRHANLKLKPSKCKFACRKVTYLGHVVSQEGVAPDEDKISAVRDFPRPHNVKTVRSFLGLANYYRRFVKDFAKIAAPLNKLLRKDQKFDWTTACEEAFKALKGALTSAPILAFPDFKEPFHLFTDASNEGIGATLGQIQNGKEVAIAYAGRDLNAAERNYSTTERETLGLIFGIRKFEPYLHGRRFILHTDHHALKWLMSVSDPSGRLARWSLLVQQHDFEIRHRPGISHANADALSRRPYNLPPPSISAYDIPGVQIDRVRHLQRRDPDLADLIDYLETSRLPARDNIARSLLLSIDDYFLSEDGLLFHIWTPKGRRRANTYQQLVIPAALRYEVLTWGHDHPFGGAHFGTLKTYEKLRLRYYWRNMFSDIQHWCRSCCDCATRKTPRNRHKAPLLPIPVQDAFDRISCDIVGPLPTTERGFSYVLVITEFLTKWCEAFPINSIDAATIARIIVDEIFTRHGAPRTLLTDRGSNFLSSLMKEVCHLLNIKKLNTTAYHPQTDGLVERFNGTLIESISMFCNSHQTDWDIFIPSILFAYRVSPCVATGDSPFYLLYGREPRLAPDVSLLPPTDLSTSVAEHRRRIVTQIETAQSLARDNIARAQELMKLQYDRTAADAPFEVGERCWVYTPKVKRGLKKKLCHLWHGPFRICRKLSPVHYQLRTCDNRLVATTVHANRMKRFYDPADRPILPPQEDDPHALSLQASDLPEDSFESDDSNPTTSTDVVTTPDIGESSNTGPVDSPDLFTAPDVYAAEKILKSRRRAGKQEFLVKWANFPASQSTWEPEDNILDKRLLDAFHSNNAS